MEGRPGPSRPRTNSAVLIGRDGAVSAQYDKRLLVPLFEREYQVGERSPTFSTTTGKSFTALICYEIYFPWFVQESLARAPDASFLVNLSSDWYFYDTEAIPHVVSQIRLRAIENQVPIVRAARFGPSGVFHQDGRYETRASSESGVALSASERSVFSRFAYAPFLGVLLALSLVVRAARSGSMFLRAFVARARPPRRFAELTGDTIELCFDPSDDGARPRVICCPRG
ncbi:nitrilase-related carbon-nitrogen hydrolase [Sorangium sp. So ce367]|uniref:nitrilase-related carbon-nitrogen hydrolase n=1 Tax=Sorangium sp. So ce367 TaxID=3133305 RepID=UPI003F61D507